MSGERDTLSVLSATAYESFGGAERIAVGLHLAYLERGLDSWLALGSKTGETPRSLQIPNDELRGGWARSLLRVADLLSGRAASGRGLRWAASRLLWVLAEPGRYARVARGLEDFDYPGSRRLLELPPRTPDVLQLHSLHGGYFDVRALPELSAAVPTVLTLHDAWLLTGHCAHPLDCTRWPQGCGECPYPDIYVPLRGDASAANWAVKRDAVARSRLYLATPSRWLMDMVERAGISSGIVESRVIPNGVDTSMFSPGDRTAARRALGLPEDRRVVLFAAREVEANPFKDYGTLLQALASLRETSSGDVLLVALGATGSGRTDSGVEVMPVPFVEDPRVVVEYYRAADAYVHAAKAENFPLAVIEAMACGVPVIASAVGGVPEQIDDGTSGLLVPPGDAAALAAAIGSVLSDEALRRSLAEEGLRRARAEFAFERQVDAYVDWFARIGQ